MKFNVLGYLIGEGFSNVFKNKKSTGASLMIMCATMLIFGLFFLIGENVNHIVKEVEEQQGMKVYILEEATEEETENLKEQIKIIDNVATVEFISKQEAYNIAANRFGEKALSPYTPEKNPFKRSYVVTVVDLAKVDEVKTQISQLENVHDVVMQSKTITALVNVANGIKWVSGIILVLLIIISIFIISNTIKLTVHARRKEISIMKYVGATNNFIRWPFIVEGIIIGVISVMISILIVGLAYNFITDKIMQSSLTSMINFSLLTFNDVFSLVITVYLILGIGIGTLGSIISMKKYLEV